MNMKPSNHVCREGNQCLRSRTARNKLMSLLAETKFGEKARKRLFVKIGIEHEISPSKKRATRLFEYMGIVY